MQLVQINTKAFQKVGDHSQCKNDTFPSIPLLLDPDPEGANKCGSGSQSAKSKRAKFESEIINEHVREIFSP